LSTVAELNERQRQILDFIRQRVRERGYPPSVREIGRAVGLASSSTVHGHLNRLEERGYIRRDPTKPRAIELLDRPATPQQWVRHVPVVGRVAAGAPILAVENATETFPLPYDWVRDDDVFLLEVKGESMIDAGILPGDRVLVRRQPTAENGDIVVALLGEEATVKRFFRERDRVRLQPENPSMEPIYTREVQIIGKVIGLVRRL
jgi:repressor LexA